MSGDIYVGQSPEVRQLNDFALRFWQAINGGVERDGFLTENQLVVQ